jgi:hypothetical protein
VARSHGKTAESDEFGPVDPLSAGVASLELLYYTSTIE